MPKMSRKGVLCVLFFVFIFPFSGFPHKDTEGRLFEKNVLEVIWDKNSIELPIVHFFLFDWAAMRVVRYAKYSTLLDGDISRQIYSLEFRTSSGKVLKEIVLPLRFANIVHDGPTTPYYQGPYIWEEKFGRNRKFKIIRTENAFRNGGNGLVIEIK